jgi:hypothetical protein
MSTIAIAIENLRAAVAEQVLIMPPGLIAGNIVYLDRYTPIDYTTIKPSQDVRNIKRDLEKISEYTKKIRIYTHTLINALPPY